MTKTLTVEGDLASADTATTLTTQGSVTAPSLVLPPGISRITTIIAAAGAEGLADGSAVFFLRLGGNAVLGGEQTLMVGAGGRIAPQAGSDAGPSVAPARVFRDLDIAVRPSDTIRIQAEMAGNDLGTARVVVTLVLA